jgi:hypothetical protein
MTVAVIYSQDIQGVKDNLVEVEHASASASRASIARRGQRTAATGSVRVEGRLSCYRLHERIKHAIAERSVACKKHREGDLDS